MTKAEIVEHIAQMTGLTKTDTALVVEGMIETLKMRSGSMPSRWGKR